MFKFRVNEEVFTYDILGNLHKGIIVRTYLSIQDFKMYQVLLDNPKFIVEVDEVRIKGSSK